MDGRKPSQTSVVHVSVVRARVDAGTWWPGSSRFRCTSAASHALAVNCRTACRRAKPLSWHTRCRRRCPGAHWPPAPRSPGGQADRLAGPVAVARVRGVARARRRSPRRTGCGEVDAGSRDRIASTRCRFRRRSRGPCRWCTGWHTAPYRRDVAVAAVGVADAAVGTGALRQPRPGRRSPPCRSPRRRSAGPRRPAAVDGSHVSVPRLVVASDGVPGWHRPVVASHPDPSHTSSSLQSASAEAAGDRVVVAAVGGFVTPSIVQTTTASQPGGVPARSRRCPTARLGAVA
jgi:hypothetical protein